MAMCGETQRPASWWVSRLGVLQSTLPPLPQPQANGNIDPREEEAWVQAGGSSPRRAPYLSCQHATAERAQSRELQQLRVMEP